MNISLIEIPHKFEKYYLQILSLFGFHILYHERDSFCFVLQWIQTLDSFWISSAYSLHFLTDIKVKIRKISKQKRTTYEPLMFA